MTRCTATHATAWLESLTEPKWLSSLLKFLAVVFFRLLLIYHWNHYKERIYFWIAKVWIQWPSWDLTMLNSALQTTCFEDTNSTSTAKFYGKVTTCWKLLSVRQSNMPMRSIWSNHKITLYHHHVPFHKGIATPITSERCNLHSGTIMCSAVSPWDHLNFPTYISSHFNWIYCQISFLLFFSYHLHKFLSQNHCDV